MKKVIFLSVIALAAAVSCSKSEVVDTKFESEAIGFDTYLGRDAQTKASVADAASLQVAKGGGIGIYGFYTGDAAEGWTEATTANLLVNENLYYNGAWTYDNLAYWTNTEDQYTFLAYAPYGHAKVTAPVGTVANPAITYEVDTDLANQTDLLYSNNAKNVTKAECTTNGTTAVSFQFQHALSRLSVQANAVMYDKTTGQTATSATTEFDNLFTITNITIKGKFNTKGSLNLNTGEWTPDTPTGDTTYDLVTTAQQLDGDFHNFSADDNYLMMIPTTFSATNKAILSVTYKINYKGAESAEITKDVEITTDFVKGTAYTIKITLQRDENNAIIFNVQSVDGWNNPENNAGQPVINA